MACQCRGARLRGQCRLMRTMHPEANQPPKTSQTPNQPPNTSPTSDQPPNCNPNPQPTAELHPQRLTNRLTTSAPNQPPNYILSSQPTVELRPRRPTNRRTLSSTPNQPPNFVLDAQPTAKLCVRRLQREVPCGARSAIEAYSAAHWQRRSYLQPPAKPRTTNPAAQGDASEMCRSVLFAFSLLICARKQSACVERFTETNKTHPDGYHRFPKIRCRNGGVVIKKL